jgi:hypothetical protein
MNKSLRRILESLTEVSGPKSASPFADTRRGTLRDNLVAALKEFYASQDGAIRAAQEHLDRLTTSRQEVRGRLVTLANYFPDMTFGDLDHEMTKFPDYDRQGSWDSSPTSINFVKLTKQLDLALKASMVDGEFEGDEDWLHFIIDAAGGKG